MSKINKIQNLFYTQPILNPTNHMKPKVAINGFGRIGREVFRVNLEKQLLDIVAINDLGDNETLAHLLKYDSNYGTLDAEISADENNITVNGVTIPVFCQRDPEQLPWAEHEVDIVIEATGHFRDGEGAGKHIKAGAKKVVISAPGKDGIDLTVVMGVNEKDYDPAQHNIISNASCTTNSLAPAVKVLHETLGIKRGMMTTIHSYTNDQRILDLPHSDLRRARAAALSIIPTTTGAAKAVTQVIPELAGKLNGMAIRVPTPTVSLVDFVFEAEKNTTPEEVNKILKKAAEGELKGILEYSDKPLVSMDYKAHPASSIVDGLSTMIIEDNLIKVLTWYDNEWGYSNRTVELCAHIGEKM